MQQPDFKALAAEACHASPLKNYSSSIAKWLESYSKKGDLAKFLESSRRNAGTTTMWGRSFGFMAAGNMFAEVPLLRLSMLTANFTAPKAERSRQQAPEADLGDGGEPFSGLPEG